MEKNRNFRRFFFSYESLTLFFPSSSSPSDQSPPPLLNEQSPRSTNPTNLNSLKLYIWTELENLRSKNFLVQPHPRSIPHCYHMQCFDLESLHHHAAWSLRNQGKPNGSLHFQTHSLLYPIRHSLPHSTFSRRSRRSHSQSQRWTSLAQRQWRERKP